MLDAAHFCMMMRGVQKQQSRTSTFCYLGDFERDSALRSEFLRSVARTDIE
jgi:GTP cyclohydrolase I